MPVGIIHFVFRVKDGRIHLDAHGVRKRFWNPRRHFLFSVVLFHNILMAHIIIVMYKIQLRNLDLHMRK